MANVSIHHSRCRDPAVAKRVRILHVYPGFLKEALDREKTGHVKPIYLRRSLRDKLAELANLKMFLKHPKMRFIRTFQRAEDVVQVMLEVLSGLPNVTDYYVTWCGLPSISVSAAPFLSTVFQSNLRKLSLELSLENVKNLLTPSFQVQNLQELKLCIHSETIGSKFERNEIMQTHLGPAISRLRNTLQILTIQSWEAADLSPMLRAIVYLPLLEQLVIAIPVESIHLGDPDGLSNFLHTHRTTLRILRLRATQFGGPGLTPNLVSFDNWVRAAVCGVNLPKLHVLDISSSLFPVYTSVTCLAHFSSTITSLSLTGCHRTYDDVEEAISLVSSHTRDEALSTLRIGLVSLSPQLVDLISTKLSGLFKLELVVRYILPHARDTPEFHLKTPSLVQGISQIVSLCSNF